MSDCFKFWPSDVFFVRIHRESHLLRGFFSGFLRKDDRFSPLSNLLCDDVASDLHRDRIDLDLFKGHGLRIEVTLSLTRVRVDDDVLFVTRAVNRNLRRKLSLKQTKNFLTELPMSKLPRRNRPQGFARRR